MNVAFNYVEWQSVYPMDFYANESLGPWTNNTQVYRPARQKRTKPVKIEQVESECKGGVCGNDSGCCVSKSENSTS